MIDGSAVPSPASFWFLARSLQGFFKNMFAPVLKVVTDEKICH
jgi:hypothetical protein